MDICGAIRFCARDPDHRGQHGGFRKLEVFDVRKPPPDDSTRLTRGEYRCVRLRAQGWTWDRICAELRISKHTLSSYMTSARAKYEADSDPELWAALGWLQVP